MPATEEQTGRLFKASEAGDVERFNVAAAEIDDDVRALRADNGANCLCIAAHAGRTELCRHLLDDLAFDVNAADSTGSTPLVLAVAGNHGDTAELLLSHGADVNARGGGEAGAAPLHLAVSNGQLELARQLLAAGADANAPSGSDTPLALAAARGDAPATELLLAHGADPNRASRSGVTPLFLAVAVAGSAAVARLLAAAGADVNARALGAFTPLHVAAEGGKADVAEALLEAGADPEARDDHGHTPARVAGMHGHRAVVEALLKRGGGGGGGSGGGGGDSGSGGGGGGAAAAAEPGPSGVDAFMRDSRAALREREAKAASTSDGATLVRVPEPEVADEALADTFKRKGNEFFVAGDYDGAAKLYGLALSHWTRNATVWSNRAACFLRLAQYEDALRDAQVARTLDPKYVKAWYREGRAAEGLRRWEDAATAFYQAAQLQPGNEEFLRLTKEAIVEGRKQLQAKRAGGGGGGGGGAAGSDSAR